MTKFGLLNGKTLFVFSISLVSTSQVYVWGEHITKYCKAKPKQICPFVKIFFYSFQLLNSQHSSLQYTIKPSHFSIKQADVFIVFCSVLAPEKYGTSQERVQGCLSAHNVSTQQPKPELTSTHLTDSPLTTRFCSP